MYPSPPHQTMFIKPSLPPHFAMQATSPEHKMAPPIEHTPWVPAEPLHPLPPLTLPLPPPSSTQPYQAVATTTTTTTKSNRVVIPSKRAAQNRAAQRAFRQRRDRYVKDLERKVKEMEGWPEEMEKLRGENEQLRNTVKALERRIAELTGGEPTTPPSANTTTTSSSSPSIPQSPTSPLPDHHQKSSSTSNFTVDHSHAPHEGDTATTTVHPQPLPPPPDFWTLDSNFDLDFAFDSVFPDDFVDNHPMSDEVLDDLFAMLQTRQRPQIPIQPSSEHPLL